MLMTARYTRRVPTGQRGFTLIEILVAVTVLAVGILGASRLLISSEAATVDSELQQIATQEAEQAIEDVRAFDYDAIGHPSGDLPNGGQPYQAPDASEAEDIVEAPDPGVPATRSFTVERGGGKAPVTGTIETYVTWRDEECSLVPPGDFSVLRTRLSALQTALAPLTGSDGHLNRTLSLLTDALILAIPSGQRPAYYSLRTELEALAGPLATTATEAQRVQDLLDTLEDPIDVCDLEPADLSGIVDLLEVDSSLLSGLTSALTPVTEKLVSLGGTVLGGPLTTLSGFIQDLGLNTCGLLPEPNICGKVSAEVGPALNALLPPSGTPPKTLAGSVNDVLSPIDIDIENLYRDHTHNTKRITVAVSIDTGDAGQTPKNKVWLSTVATDPEAGLIIDASVP